MLKFLVEDLNLVLEGRKPLPVGTLRSRGGKDYVKTKTGWAYVPTRNRKSKKSAQAHYSKTGRVPHGYKLGDDGISVAKKSNPRALSAAKKAKQSAKLHKVDRRSKKHKDLMNFVRKIMPAK